MVEGIKIEGEASKRAPLRSNPRDSGLFGAEDTLRVDLRPDSLREAEEYARQIEEGLNGEGYNSDKLHIDPSEVPEGWTYQWVSTTIVGMENTHHLMEMRRQGWREVQASRHPYKMPPGYVGAIVVEGLTLMEKPKVLTDRAHYEHIKQSRAVLRNSEDKLYETPANTAPRDDPGLRNKVKRTIERPEGARED